MIKCFEIYELCEILKFFDFFRLNFQKVMLDFYFEK